MKFSRSTPNYETFSCVDMSSKQQAKQTSILLRLPLELRSMIYEFALEDDKSGHSSKNTPFWHPKNGFCLSETCKQIQSELVHLLLLKKEVTFEMICETYLRRCRSTMRNLRIAKTLARPVEMPNVSPIYLPDLSKLPPRILADGMKSFTPRLSDDDRESFFSKNLNIRICSCIFVDLSAIFEALPEIKSYTIRMTTCRYIEDAADRDKYTCMCSPNRNTGRGWDFSCYSHWFDTYLQDVFNFDPFLEKLRENGWTVKMDGDLNLKEEYITTWYIRRIPWVAEKPKVGF